MILALYLGGLYLLVGILLAYSITPFSSSRWLRYALIVLVLWPWPLAGHLVCLLKGRYPRWMLFL